MAQEIYDINELTEQILNDYATQYGVDVSDLDNSIRVQAKVDAGLLYPLYLSLAKVQENIYPDLAEESQLIRWGYAILQRYPAPATQGEYEATVTGDVGATIPAQTQFRGNDDIDAAGKLFILDADFTLSATTDTIQIRALEAGTESRLAIGDTLSSIQPLVNVDNEIVVSSVVTEPTAAETEDEYRQDVLNNIRILPQGGAPGDYRLWTLEIPEIRTVYPYVRTKSGDVDIWIEVTPDNTKTGEPVGVPTQDVIDKVYKVDASGNESGAVIWDELRQRGRKPVDVINIYPKAIEPLTVDVNLIGLSDVGKADDIRSAIDALLYDIRPYVAGAQSSNTKNDILTVSQVISEIYNVLAGTGVTYTSLTIDVDGNEVTDFTFTFGNYPYLNTLTNNGSPI